MVLLHAVYVISGFTKCYPTEVNAGNYCFYTDGSVLSWDEAREFCKSMNFVLPIIRDEVIDNVFQQFILDSNNVTVSGSDTQDISNYVWLGAQARRVDDSAQWHWINGPPSG